MPYKNLIKNKLPDIRRLFDMKEVIFDQEWLKGQRENLELYYMYRDLGVTEEEKREIHDNNLRYDITIIPPLALGQEFNKTAGHYHSKAENDLSFPEIYEVLEGEAYYLIQSEIKNDCVKDAYFVHAAKGDKVIIPPNYGHFTINAGKKNLVMANWISLSCVSDYRQVKQKRGACYYAIAKNDESEIGCIPNEFISGGITEKNMTTTKKINWLQNKNYGKIPELRKLDPTNFSELGLDRNKEVYCLVDDLGKLDFLVQPEKYGELWKKILG
jgi:glucose-6-phosphate isomerase